MDEVELHRQLTAYKSLIGVSRLINGITDLDELLPEVLEAARAVTHAEASSLFVADAATGDLRLCIARGPGGEISCAHLVIPRGQGIAGWVFEHRQPLLVPDAYADPRFYADVDRHSGFTTRSLLCVPLSRGDTCIGVLQVLNPVENSAFVPGDLEIFEAYASLVATAIEKLEALSLQREQDRFEGDLERAAEIQRGFLPSELPCRDEACFAAFYRPARNIGGDFYDLVEISPRELVFILGDVSGKGLPAALVMAQSLSLLRLILAPGLSPSEALRRWGASLAARDLGSMFVTAFLAVLDPVTGDLEFACAGHPPPFLKRRGFPAKVIDCDSAPPLGILDAEEFPRNTLHLAPGDTLVLCSDGLTESFAPDRSLFGDEGVCATLDACSECDALIAVDAIVAAENAHRAGAEPADDTAILALSAR